MAKKTANHRQPWKKSDVKALLKHSKKRTPVPEIAQEMKRTIAALRIQAFKLGVGLGHQR